jgi:competence protein ComEC
VLSISGYHMAVVAGIVFFILRALLALIPGLTDRLPVKKWAAFGALIVTTLYLVLSGAEVATQRSFIMIAIVLIGVVLDRPVLTLRTVTIAALVVLFLSPEAVVHPSFQMSFAATLALIAAYAYGQPLARAGANSPLATRAALWGVKEIVSLLLASLIAGLATTPYAAYHFHRMAPYGVIANLLAMPVVSAWVMPMGILGVVGLWTVSILLENQLVMVAGAGTTQQRGHKLASIRGTCRILLANALAGVYAARMTQNVRQAQYQDKPHQKTQL